MATLTVSPVTRAGLTIVGASAGASGDEWPNTGQEVVLVTNGSGSSVTVTLDIKITVDGAAITDPTVTVPAGESRLIGPFPMGYYNDSSTGRAKITYSAVTSVTVKVFKVTPA